MFEIRFYNELGEVSLGRGPWRLTAADGLAIPQRSFKTADYSGCDSSEIVGSRALCRTVTLRGDAFDVDADELSRVMKVLYKSGTLEVNAWGKSRHIKAVCTEFLPEDTKGRYRLFTLQFLCASPYFESAEAREVPIFKVIPCIDREFKLPGVFSKRISRRTINYEGNVSTQPVIYITVGHTPQGNLSIINHTSGESLSFNYEPLTDEIITVDVKNRKIYNSEGESLLKYLSDFSFFDGFHLYPGENDIEVLLGTMNNDLTVTCSFYEEFLEAVV